MMGEWLVLKLLNWFSKIIAQTLIISGLTVYLTWIVVHTYVDKLLSKYHIDSAESKVQLSDFISQLSQSINSLKMSNQQSQTLDAPTDTSVPSSANVLSNREGQPSPLTMTPSPSPSPGSPSPGITASSTPKSMQTTAAASAQPQAAAVPTPKPETTPAPEDSMPVLKQISGAGDQSAADQTAAEQKQKSLMMSAEEFTKKKNSLSETDKVKIFSLLAARLPPDQLQQISTYVEDGITAEEWQAIQNIVGTYLSADEYKQLEDIIAKY
jgi:hypothetical protein